MSCWNRAGEDKRAVLHDAVAREAADPAALRETEISISSLTAACGFESENYAKNLFKARFGMSMSAYRASQ